MKKKSVGKNIIIIVAIILANNLLLLLMNFVYVQLNNKIERSNMEALCMDIQAQVDSDADFESVYGEVTEVVLDKKHASAFLGDRTFLIPCIVKTENGQNYFIWFKYHQGTNAKPIGQGVLVK